MCRRAGSEGVQGKDKRVPGPGGQGVGLRGPRALRGRPTKSKEVKGYPTGSQGVNV